MANGPAGYGQGGVPNYYPGRGYPEFGSPTYRDMPNDWVGGARGPAALPSRVAPDTPAGVRPAPSTPAAGNSGARGTISFHRGAYVEDAGAPRLVYDNELYHNHLPWARPFYPNIAGQIGYHPPTQQPSWTAGTAISAGKPLYPIPFQKKRIANFMVRRPFGDNSAGVTFPPISLAGYVGSTAWHQGVGRVQGRRWMRQAKTHNPVLFNRSTYGTAGSYGQTTRSLNTMPTNVPASNSSGGNFGSY